MGLYILAQIVCDRSSRVRRSSVAAGSRKAQAAPSDALNEYSGQFQTNKASRIWGVFDFQLAAARLRNSSSNVL